jgi:pectin methylesterase-like acyl-CoA thioesterase
MRLPPLASALFSGLALCLAPFAARASFPLDRTMLFPADGAAQVCPDTPLRIRFAGPAILGSSGLIRVYDAADHRLVASIDATAGTAFQTIGGIPNFKYRPVIIEGAEARIFLPNHTLAYGRTYAVTVAPGVFTAKGEPSAAIAEDAAWRFTTKSAPPVSGSAQFTVAADGTGDFCTVQGAIDFLPPGNLAPTTIFVRRGTYTEIVAFSQKHAITLRGEDRHQTVIAYANNAKFNDGGGNPYAAGASAEPKRRSIYHRAVFLADQANDLVLANLTIRDTTPQGGTQAEAIILNGTPSSRAILQGVDLYSYQDTLQINGQAYLENCFIEGDVDFMWGKGPCFFEGCTCRALRSGAYYTQIRNPDSNHGFVYRDCTFDGVRGIMGNYLSRIEPDRFPHSEVVLLGCVLGDGVGEVAWQLQGARPGTVAPAAVHFWEFGSHAPDGKPVDAAQRLPGSRQLSSAADAALIASYSDPVFVLGHGWDPRVATARLNPAATAQSSRALGAPGIARAPTNQLALLGTGALLSVAVIGTEPLRYQWSRDGTDLPGAISATLRLPAVGWGDAGNYCVAVANAAGTVTSAAAELIAVAPDVAAAPQLPQIPAAVFDVTVAGARADGLTDNTASIQKTIDRAAAAGGGIVYFPSGPRPYLSGPIVLASLINLQIDAGAVLRALPYAPQATPAVPAYPLNGERYSNFITASNHHDIALTGGGRIDGDGRAWWQAFAAHKEMAHRPYLIRFDHCQRVLLTGVTLTDSAMFHAALGAIDQLTVFGIKIDAPVSPNTDGVDPSGSHQLIQNCAIACGDDNIAVKAGGSFCSDLTIADCVFGIGHGVSVGGQSNSGLNGMTVKNCLFDGTVSALRLKADATQGGLVQNVSYTNLAMRNVDYPIVFYSYYNRTGNPGALSGKNAASPEKAQEWNQHPPNSLRSKTLPAWKSITLTNVIASGSKGRSIIWGLPLPGYLIEGVTLHDVHLAGDQGIELFDAANVQFTGTTQVGPVIAGNALAITRQPQAQAAAAGAPAKFSAEVVSVAGTQSVPPRYQWNFNGHPLADGARSDGSEVAGAATAELTLAKVQSAEAGKYSVTVSTRLDGFDPEIGALVSGSIPVSATSAAAPLTIAAAGGG